MDSGLRQCLTPRSIKRSLDRDLETSGKRVSQLWNCLYHVSPALCGWGCHPSACGPRLYKKGNWTWVSKQASKQSSPWDPHFHFHLQGPAFDGLCATSRPNEPVPPQLVLNMILSQQQRHNLENNLLNRGTQTQKETNCFLSRTYPSSECVCMCLKMCINVGKVWKPKKENKIFFC